MYIHYESRKLEYKKPRIFGILQLKRKTYCFIKTKYPEIVSSVIDNYPYKQIGSFYFWSY